MLTSHCRLAARKQFLDYCNPKEKVNSYKWDPQVDLANLSGSLKDCLFLDGSGRGRRGSMKGGKTRKSPDRCNTAANIHETTRFILFKEHDVKNTVTMDFPG